MTLSRLRDALAECATLLGPDRVSINSIELAQVNAATFVTEAVASAVLKPANRAQVADCLRIANQYQVPVYPVSTGKNWGYGSAVAPQTGCMLLSLAGLDRIVDFDAHAGRVRLEPGVTFHQLSSFLRDRGALFQPPYTGSGTHTSVVGNIMERGIGKGLYEDMAAHVHACVALLANGETLTTNQDASGPDLFGLLPQSNLAVVVEITLRLEPAPQLSQLITFPIPGGVNALVHAVGQLHDTALRGAPRSQLAFLNDYRIASQIERFPHDTLDATAALPRDWMRACLEPWQGAQWIGACTLWADDADELAWRRNALNKALGALGLTPRLELPIEKPQLDLDNDGLRCAYWRKTFPMPSHPDPDRDRCGVIWIAPVVPVGAPHLATLITQLETTTLAHGFEPALALRSGHTGSLRLIFGLFFDRDLPGADARALQCHAALQAVLHAAQIPRYRYSLLDHSSDESDRGVRSAMTALKAHFDPHGILAPQRYCAP